MSAFIDIPTLHYLESVDLFLIFHHHRHVGTSKKVKHLAHQTVPSQVIILSRIISYVHLVEECPGSKIEPIIYYSAKLVLIIKLENLIPLRFSKFPGPCSPQTVLANPTSHSTAARLHPVWTCRRVLKLQSKRLRPARAKTTFGTAKVKRF